MAKNLQQFLESIDLDALIELDDIPDIDLYMDQVIQIFENKFAKTKRTDDEKILTKTMINNYAKGKLFFPIKNKKYTKIHLLLISLIYQLKGTLTLTDIKTVLTKMNEKIVHEQFDLVPLYQSFLHLAKKNTEQVKKDIEEKGKVASEEVGKIVDEDADYMETVLLICTLAHMSNLYRRTAERLVDTILKEDNQDK